MKDWLNLNPEQLGREQRERKNVQGVDIDVLMSPYEVPAAVRGYLEDKERRYVIEFKYIDEEPWTLQTMEQPISLRVGRNSNRLVGIQIDVETLKAKAIDLDILVGQVGQAIERFAKQVHTNARQANYAVAKEVIAERGPQLLENLVAAE